MRRTAPRRAAKTRTTCAARGCHGAVGPTSPATGDVFIKDGASTTWRYYDPHARGFEVLRGKRSLAMAERQIILRALRANASRERAAEQLGISARTLRYKLARLRAAGVDLSSEPQMAGSAA